MPSKKTFVPLKSYKPITSERQARKATSEFHHGGGNRTTYQAASALLTDLHKTSSKFVFRTITKLNRRPGSGEAPLKTLEVGAVNTQLLESPFLDVLAIDLKSRHPRIKEIDFFSLEPKEEYDILVLAMVLNCVPTPEARGRMLVMCRDHLKQNGLFFLILPSRCFPGDSRTWFENHVMKRLGFEPVTRDSTPKVFSTCFRLVEHYPLKDQIIRFSQCGGLVDLIIGAETADGAKKEDSESKIAKVSSSKRRRIK